MKYRIVTLIAALAMLASPAMAQQQMACGERAGLLEHLKEKFKETAAGIGMTGNGAVIELMTSETGSWSLILTFPSGKSCLMATGDGWEQGKAKMAGRDA